MAQSEALLSLESQRSALSQADTAPEYRYEEIFASHEASDIPNQAFTEEETKILEENAQRLMDDNPKRAEEMLHKWIENEEYSLKAMFLLAQTYMQTERFEEALDILFELRGQTQSVVPSEDINKLIHATEEKYSSLLREGKAHHELLNLYEKMIQHLPDDLRYYYKLAEVQNQLGQSYEALASLDYLLYDPSWSSQAKELLQEVTIKLELEDQIKVPLERSGEQFIVPATLNGSSNIRLLLDTGASISLLRPQTARQIGLSVGAAEDEIVLNTVSGVANAPVATVGSFEVGETRLTDINVSILEMPPGIDSDGLLGMDFLSRFKFFINQDEGILYLGAR